MFADSELAHRLFEPGRSLARATAAASYALDPEGGEAFLTRPTTYAMFCGDGSPLTQASGEFQPDELEAVQKFFKGRVENWEAIVTPFGGAEPLQRLIDVGAKPTEWQNTLFRELNGLPPMPTLPAEVHFVEAEGGWLDAWAEVARIGFFAEDDSPITRHLNRVMATMGCSKRYLALWNDQPAAVAALFVVGGRAFLGGAATMPEFRGRGLHSALLIRRLHDANGLADFVTMGASPGGSSQRNAERLGLRVAYTQLSLSVPA